MKENLTDKYARAQVGLRSVETMADSMDIKERTYDIIILHNPIFMDAVRPLLLRDAWLMLKVPIDTLALEEVEQRWKTSLIFICHKRSKTHDIFLWRKVSHTFMCK